MVRGLEGAEPRRVQAVGLSLRRLWRSGGVWLGAAFIGFMFTTAITMPVPAVADWQGAIICGSGQHLTHLKYITHVGAILQQNGSYSSPTTGEGFSFHCIHGHELSGSKTALVLALQFIASTVAAYLLILLLAAQSSFRKAGRVRAAAAVAAPPP